MTDLSLLTQLVAYADHGTLSAAAKWLHTSQPALTRAMKRLEDELRLSLFTRSKNHIALTPTGEMAVCYARRLLAEAEEFETRLRAYERSLHTITVGFCSPVPQIVMTPLLSRIFDGITISADMKDDRDFFTCLCRGTYQLAVTHLPPTDMETFHAVKCGHEDLFLSLPVTHPLAVHPSLKLSQLAGEMILLLQSIGFWMNTVHAKTTETHYLMQSDRMAVTEIAANSPYPIFQSSYFITRDETIPDRISIPLIDAVCHTDYFLVCLRAQTAKFHPLFAKVRENTIT